MSWPLSYDDVLSKNDFPTPDSIKVKDIMGMFMGKGIGEGKSERNVDFTEYNDGIFVGYRHYLSNKVPTAFPFGYGLSYTTFAYSGFKVTKAGNGDINVTVTVKNTGKYKGKEVVQVYVAAPGNDMRKPARELRGFAKTGLLSPGNEQMVKITIPYAELASFCEADSQWQVESGNYSVMVARNAADTKPLVASVSVEGAVTEKVLPCLLREQ